jgi:hypothetical protein
VLALVTRKKSGGYSDGDARGTRGERELTRVLRRVNEALFRYPLAAQAAFSSLVAEGRRYARTPEGAVWRDRLLAARETANAQLLWEILSSRTFMADSSGVLPDTLVDSLSRAIRLRGLEPLLARILRKS